MRIQAAFVVVGQVTMLAYALWAVHNRNDRRRVPKHFVDGLHGLVAFAGVTLLIALTLNEAASGRAFLSVRELFEIGFMACAAATCLAIRILKGAPYDRDQKKEIKP